MIQRGYKAKKIEFIKDVKYFNELLSYCKKYYNIIYSKPELPLLYNAYIEVKEVRIELTFKDAYGACTYIFRLDGQEDKQCISGIEAFRTLQMYCKTPKMHVGFSASPFLWKNDKYENKRTYAYCYDMNSAYAYALIQPMPDVWKCKKPQSKYVEDGEIGFNEFGQRITSGFAPFVFPLVESPYKGFVDKWYGVKSTTTDADEKMKAKNYLCFAVGYMQRYNPFIRAQVLGIAQEVMENLIDENTLYCNTDSIITRTKRDDLVIGKGLGEWKLEKEGEFAFVGFNYQWNYDVPSYRHKSKSWFNKGWDILKDEAPITGNLYTYDYTKIKLIKEI